jgi:hypothetical protein
MAACRTSAATTTRSLMARRFEERQSAISRITATPDKPITSRIAPAPHSVPRRLRRYNSPLTVWIATPTSPPTSVPLTLIY